MVSSKETNSGNQRIRVVPWKIKEKGKRVGHRLVVKSNVNYAYPNHMPVIRGNYKNPKQKIFPTFERPKKNR